MRKYLRGLAKANMQRLGFGRINRRMWDWRHFISKEVTDRSILEALGPDFVKKFKEAEQKRAQKRAKRKEAA